MIDISGYYLSDGINSRFEDFVQVTKALIVIGVLVYMAMAINQYIPMTMFLNIVPLLYVAITVIVVVGIFSVPEYGPLFTVGWTIASLVLAGVGVMGVGELLLDLVPIAIVVYYAVEDNGFSRGYLGGM